MKLFPILLLVPLLFLGCTSTEKLTYLNNLPESNEPQYFPMDIPDYKLQYRDILYVTIKALNPDGSIEDMLQGSSSVNAVAYIGNESTQYVIGYNIEKEGEITLPVIGKVHIGGKTIKEAQEIVQLKAAEVFQHSFVECKLLSFKYTVLGEVNIPGMYMNYNNYLTVLEAIGRAGGVGDFGRQDRVLVLRPTTEGTKTFRVNLHDKNLLLSEAYFLQPNDVIIIEPLKQKIFNLNLPTISFIISSLTGVVTTTLLLINFFESN